MKLLWWNCCESIVHKLWFISCDEIVVMKYSMKYVMKYSMKFCHYNCCDEELFHRCVEDVLKMCWRCVEWSVKWMLKMCWRIVEELLKICIIICIKLVMSVWTLLDRFSKIIRWRCEVLFSIFETKWWIIRHSICCDEASIT